MDLISQRVVDGVIMNEEFVLADDRRREVDLQLDSFCAMADARSPPTTVALVTVRREFLQLSGVGGNVWGCLFETVRPF